MTRPDFDHTPQESIQMCADLDGILNKSGFDAVVEHLERLYKTPGWKEANKQAFSAAAGWLDKTLKSDDKYRRQLPKGYGDMPTMGPGELANLLDDWSDGEATQLQPPQRPARPAVPPLSPPPRGRAPKPDTGKSHNQNTTADDVASELAPMFLDGRTPEELIKDKAINIIYSNIGRKKFNNAHELRVALEQLFGSSEDISERSVRIDTNAPNRGFKDRTLELHNLRLDIDGKKPFVTVVISFHTNLGGRQHEATSVSSVVIQRGLIND